MKQEFDQLNNKIDKVDDRLNKIDTHLAVYNEQLKVHIKRTELIESDLSPIKDHVNQVKGMIKLLAACATIAGLILAYLTYYGTK